MSGTIRIPVPEWWPPKVGDRLRGVWGPDPKDDPLLHVVAVFDHDTRTQIVTAQWSAERQSWWYEVRGPSAAHVRPDQAGRRAAEARAGRVTANLAPRDPDGADPRGSLS